MQKWWAGLSGPERMMIAAVGLSLLGLLFNSGNQTHHYLTNMTSTDFYTGRGSTSVPATGWELRGMRGVILPLAVAAVFGLGLARNPSLRGWIYWVAGLVLFVATVPSIPPSLGGLFAYGAIGLTFWTAWKVGKAMKAERAAATPPA